jgi:hypothetical protein
LKESYKSTSSLRRSAYFDQCPNDGTIPALMPPEEFNVGHMQVSKTAARHRRRWRQTLRRNNKMTKRSKIDLLSWINNGVFDGVSLGDTKQGVVDQLGAPCGWGGDDKDFIDANFWSYGIWDLIFEGDALDGIRCGISALHSHGWYFDVESYGPFLSAGTDEVKDTLDQHNIAYISFPGVRYKNKHLENIFFTIRNIVTEEIIECKRGPKVPMILAGKELRTSILFNRRGNSVVAIGSPFCLRTQEWGYKKLDPKGSYTLV